MASIRDQLLDYFEQFANDDARLIEEIHTLIALQGKGVYSYIFQILTNLDLSPEESEQHWNNIISHSKKLSATMGREVNLRTAVCDYFCSINKSLHNPKIIEIHLFEKAAKSSTFDNLTGLLNRNAFDEMLSREISRAKRHDSNLTLLFLDLDDFKRVNDTMGHMAGDEVLKKVAQLIMVEKRSEDIGARYGGEEITVLLPETSKEDGWLIGERIRQSVEEAEIRYEGKNIKITLSGGLASFPIDASDGLTLLKNADKAMYRAKSFGKNNISFYSMDKRRNIRVDYSTSVEIQELGIHKKPVLKATTKSLSIGGILLESKDPLEIGAKIQINISLNKDNPLLVIGTVVRSEETDEGNHEISIAFIDSDKVIKNEISSYLIKHLKEIPAHSLKETQSQQ
ncbi:MAG: diguanylate cyclase [Deltaproteobacteria bacterium]|nr:MAG: diguanylate cyclase [Deltaproteobacteria bacterium]